MKNVIEQDEEFYCDSQLNEDICPASPTMQLSEDTAAFRHGSNLLTPKQELVHNEPADQALLSNSSASSCCSSSDISAKGGFDSLSLSPEFESESYSSSPNGHQKSALNGMQMTLQENYLEMGLNCQSRMKMPMVPTMIIWIVHQSLEKIWNMKWC
ncbi:hypothetical protein P3S68_022331 [Capsicum galapagoense]